METSEARTIGQALDQTAASEARVCETHGDFIARKFSANRWTNCPQCQHERDQKRREEAEQARAFDLYYGRMVVSGIPRRFEGKSLDNFTADTELRAAALEAARTYVESFRDASNLGSCLVFCGKAGTGKTHLATAILHEVIKAGYSGRFVGVIQAIREVKETYRRDAEHSERDVLGRLISHGLLVLDEVGVQFGTDAEKLILFEIINGRYEAVRPTIVISNLAKDGLKDYLGERAFDRLRENGGKLVVFDWESYRGRA